MKTILFFLIFFCSSALAMDDNDLDPKKAELGALSCFTKITKRKEGNIIIYTANWKNGDIDCAHYFPSSGRCNCSRTCFCHDGSLNIKPLNSSYYDLLKKLYKRYKLENIQS